MTGHIGRLVFARTALLWTINAHVQAEAWRVRVARNKVERMSMYLDERPRNYKHRKEASHVCRH